jgi:hypothetical protein
MKEALMIKQVLTDQEYGKNVVVRGGKHGHYRGTRGVLVDAHHFTSGSVMYYVEIDGAELQFWRSEISVEGLDPDYAELLALHPEQSEIDPLGLWSSKWPTENGFYFFYGWPYGYLKRGKAHRQLYTAKVTICNGTQSGCFIHVDGNPIYRHDGAQGVWLRIPTPDLPEVK